jgi:hypothetical protein
MRSLHEAVLWVSTPDTDAEQRALDILGRCGGLWVHAHQMAREWGTQHCMMCSLIPSWGESSSRLTVPLLVRVRAAIVHHEEHMEKRKMRITNLICLWSRNLSMHAEHLMHRHRLIFAAIPLLFQVAGTGWAGTDAIYAGPIEVTDSFNPGFC